MPFDDEYDNLPNEEEWDNLPNEEERDNLPEGTIYPFGESNRSDK